MRSTSIGGVIVACALAAIAARPAGAQTGISAAHAEAAVRVAVLTGEGERAVNPTAMAQLEAALTSVKDIALLERTQIAKILAEQKLSASGLSDPATAVRLGRLLPVDIFLLLERIPKSQPAICRAQCIEAQTGIALAAGCLDETQLSGTAPEFNALIAAAVARQRIPVGARHYLGILSVRSEEPGRALDDAAEALEMFLSADLQTPELVVLDREHLDLLQREKSLAGIWLKLKGSAELLSAGLQRAADGKSLEISLRLASTAGGEPLRLKVSAPKDDARAWRRAAADAILSALKQKPQAREESDPEREARLFDREPGRRAAQAALALAPNDFRRWRIASYLEGEAAFLWNGRVHSDEEISRALKAGIRAREIMGDVLRHDRERMERGEKDLLFTKYGDFEYIHAGAAGNVLPPAAGETAALRDEFVRLEEEVFQAKLKYGLELWRRNLVREGCRDYYYLWRIGYGTESECFPNTFEQRLRILGRIVEAAAADPPLPLKPEDEYHRWDETARLACSLGSSGFEYAAWEPENAAALNAVTKKWLEHPSPCLRMIACASLVLHHAGANMYGPRFVDEFTRNFPDGHPSRTRDADYAFFAALADRVILEMSNQGADTKLIEEACRKIVGGCIERKDVGHLRRWNEGLFNIWFTALDTLKRWRDEDELIAKMIDAYRQPDQPRAYAGEVRALEARRKKLALKLGAAPEKQTGPTLAEQEAGWNEDYNVSVIKLDGYAGPQSNFWQPTIVRDNRFFSVWEERSVSHNLKQGQAPYTLRARAYALPDGGAPVLDVQLTALTKHARGVSALRGLACSDKALYAATAVGAAVFPLDGGAPWMADEENGLSAWDVQAIECHEGKVYMLLGGALNPHRAFICYDPAVRASKLIISTRSLEPRADMPDFKHGLELAGLFSDPQRKCLWLMARFALWRYDPEKDHFDKVMVPPQWPVLYPSNNSYDGVVRHKDAFLLRSGGGTGVLRFDVENMQVSNVKGATWPALLDGENVIGRGGYSAKWRPARDLPSDATPLPYGVEPKLAADESLTTGGTVLVLLRPGKAPAAKVIPYFHALLETKFGILAVSGGKAWLVKRKGETQQ